MIVNTEVSQTPLEGKIWKSEHVLCKSFFKVKIKDGKVTFPTTLVNSTEDYSVQAPNYYQVSIYEMGQLMGGN